MSKKWTATFLIILAVVLFLAVASATRPQLSQDELDFVVENVIKTLNPDALAESIASTVESRVLAKLDVSLPMDETTVAQLTSATELTASATPEKFNGAHAKYVSSVAYANGEMVDGKIVARWEFVPNEFFNFDVVFENDGSVPWPAVIELRHVGTAGEYTGHAESVFLDTTYNPVLPGTRRGFSISAHGSENLGYHTFYFQMYDAANGSLIGGGSGYFGYSAR